MRGTLRRYNLPTTLTIHFRRRPVIIGASRSPRKEEYIVSRGTFPIPSRQITIRVISKSFRGIRRTKVKVLQRKCRQGRYRRQLPESRIADTQQRGNKRSILYLSHSLWSRVYLPRIFSPLAVVHRSMCFLFFFSGAKRMLHANLSDRSVVKISAYTRAYICMSETYLVSALRRREVREKNRAVFVNQIIITKVIKGNNKRLLNYNVIIVKQKRHHHLLIISSKVLPSKF